MEKKNIPFKGIWTKVLTLEIVNRTICLLSLVLGITSCGAPKDISYFQELENLQEIAAITQSMATYKSQDMLRIVISASDPEAAIPFNAGTATNFGDSGALGNASGVSGGSLYLIDSDGMIEFPIVGQLKVAGLTNTEVKDLVKEKLKTYINDPIVAVQLQNFKITVLGEVKNPGPFTINNERVTLIEAIGLAGDLGIQGKRDNVTVIRQENNKQVVHKVDLTTQEIFSSPVYYLAQNDVIYVEPNKSKAKLSRTSNWPRVLTSVTSVVGIIISVIAITR